MPSIMEELAADQDPRVTCATCAWLDSRPAAERAEWDQAMSARIGDRFRFTHSSIWRAVQKRGVKVPRNSIENHRRSGHRA